MIINKGGVSHYDLAIYIKKYLKVLMEFDPHLLMEFLMFSCGFQQFIITYVNIKFNLNWYKFSWTWKDTC